MSAEPTPPVVVDEATRTFHLWFVTCAPQDIEWKCHSIDYGYPPPKYVWLHALDTDSRPRGSADAMEVVEELVQGMKRPAGHGVAIAATHEVSDAEIVGERCSFWVGWYAADPADAPPAKPDRSPFQAFVNDTVERIHAQYPDKPISPRDLDDWFDEVFAELRGAITEQVQED